MSPPLRTVSCAFCAVCTLLSPIPCPGPAEANLDQALGLATTTVSALNSQSLCFLPLKMGILLVLPASQECSDVQNQSEVVFLTFSGPSCAT